MTTTEDILSDVVIFLRETLAAEELSMNANQRRLALLQKITARDSIAFSYIDMNGSHKSVEEVESGGECYEELESSWSGSGGSSNISRSYSNTLPTSNRHQKFSFFFVNGLCESKNKDFGKNSSDSNEFNNDISKRNSVLSDSDNSLSRSSVKSEDSLEIMSISASAIKYSAVKCGPLFKKEKLLFVEHSKRYWVALLGTTLFIYNNEKDSKPINNINVDEYNARPIAVNQPNKKEFGFEIVCPGKKTYQFFSTSHSEMETWISSINHSLPLPQTSTLSSTSTPNILQCSEQELGLPGPEFNDKQRSISYRYEDKPTERELPSIPVFLHYDTPNPICRAVISEQKCNRLSSDSLDGLLQETFYQSIDESLAEQLARYDYPIRNDPVFKNKENYYQDDNVYYNMLNQIHQNQKEKENGTLKKEQTLKNSSNKNDEKDISCRKNGMNRIRQIIQKMEEINNQNTTFNKKMNASENKLLNSPVNSPISEEIYELVK